MTRERFVTSFLPHLLETNRSPIYGYQLSPVLTLDEAIEELKLLVPGIVNHVSTAKQKCNRHSTLLTWDESAAIYLYSMPKPLFSCLNASLRAEDQHKTRLWFPFLKVLMTALEKLPSTKATVWRGINYDDTLTFIDNDVHIWWSVISCSRDVQIVQPFVGEHGTLFAIDAINGKDISAFSAFPEEQEVILMPGTRVRRKYNSANFVDCFFVLHLEEDIQRKSRTQSHYLFELIKQEYQRNGRIELIMNPSKSFPIGQSYINLAIVENKEQQDREKKLLSIKQNDEIISTYEAIYGSKSVIGVEHIFNRCNDLTKTILVLGRAGIGKTTFCRYVAYQWAIGAIWQQYDLVIFIRLRSLTETRYPPSVSGTKYSLIDLVKTEYFYSGLSEKHEQLFKEHFDNSQVLWLLDGYDEIVQNVPPHLEYLFEQLLKTSNHILTSRPYLNTLSYDVQFEITGFTDDNIQQYVKQFFDQINNKKDNASLQSSKLHNFLERNRRVWGIAHIPVNLELICSLWCDTDLSETATLSMTTVYENITEWLCRRHIEKQNIPSNQMTKEDVYKHCRNELEFLESFAFHGMISNTLIHSPKLLQIACKDSGCSLQHQRHLLNIGILKSLDYKAIGTRIEADKNHYFVHLSFQEHFAARYLIKALNSSEDRKKKAIDFINRHKYNQRFELVLTFTSGLLLDSEDEQCVNSFWKTLLGEPLDLIGSKHVQIIVSCLEETDCNRNLSRFCDLMNSIIEWLQYVVSKGHEYLLTHIRKLLSRSPSLVNQPEIINTMVVLHQNKDSRIKENVSILISNLPISYVHSDLIHSQLAALDDCNEVVRQNAFITLGNMGEKVATNDVINRLVIALRNSSVNIRWAAWSALGKISAKAASYTLIDEIGTLMRYDNDDGTDYDINKFYKIIQIWIKNVDVNESINRLIVALGDSDNNVRRGACLVVNVMWGRVTTNEVINALVIAMEDTDDIVRINAYQALKNMDEKAATSEIIKKLVSALGDPIANVRRAACSALVEMVQSTTTHEMIDGLLIAIEDTDDIVRTRACQALGRIREEATTNEALDRLVTAVEDRNYSVRSMACQALGKMGIKAATNEVINGLLVAIGDTNNIVRISAYQAFGILAEKVATNKVIKRLVSAVKDKDNCVRGMACQALGKMGINAATNEVIDSLLVAVGDADNKVRISACEALQNMGIGVTTNEVIHKFLLALDHTDVVIKQSACSALGHLGEKAATNEVLNKLVTAIGDTDCSVRIMACHALGKMGINAANNEVLGSLLVAVEDADNNVKISACEALGHMGKKAATDNVISRLMHAVGDADQFVRSAACQALKKMDIKSVTNEMINRLLVALNDTNVVVRQNACSILENMDEKLTTDEVIDGLIAAIDDKDDIVRQNACSALGEMGMKAAKNNLVINRLLRALADRNSDVRLSAQLAYKCLCEKAGTKEMINGLMIALEHTNAFVRGPACDSLRILGVNAATDKVINGLLIAVGDASDEVRQKACKALENMGENAATNAVIEVLLNAFHNDISSVRSAADKTIERILPSLSCMSDLKDDAVDKLLQWINQLDWTRLKNIDPVKYIELFLTTKITCWLPKIKHILISKGYGIIVTENTVVVYGNEEPVTLNILDREIGQQLKEFLIH